MQKYLMSHLINW